MMSEDGSPSLLNLRGFRIQKKPTFCHSVAPVCNGSLDTSSECSPDFKVKAARRRILPISESDSECEGTINKPKMSDFEVIEIVDDDYEETTSADNAVVASQNNTTITTSIINFDINHTETKVKTEETKAATTTLDQQQKPVETAGVVKPSNGLIYNITSRPKKTEAVIEKEKQMRFLREKYPKMESMAIHDILSKHNFDIDKAIEDLEAKLQDKQQKLSSEDFANWKEVQEKNDALKAAQENKILIQHVIAPTSVVRKRINMGEFSNATKKKAKRMRTEAVSDESDHEINEYKDNRVFDSDEDSDAEISNELTHDKKKVLEFFQSALPSELQLMTSCSKKKADLIMECRPFEGWIDLVEKLKENKTLSTDLLNAAQEVLVTRTNIERLMNNCKSLAKRMEHAVAAGAGVKEQPALLDPNKTLTPHQMVGLNWLAVLHEQRVNGILADEMGLGKTIQVIAFLAHLKEKGATLGIPHLIIVPSSTLENWHAELERWCPQLKVFKYYGSTEERKMYRIEYWSKGAVKDYDIILTTYSMVSSSPEERKMFRITQMHYVVFDEAHMLKNMNTIRYENLIRIKAKNRILLTGTPLQNNLLELMSLLIFVMPDMFAGRSEDLKSLFQKNSKAAKQMDEKDLPEFERNQIKHAKDIMKPFVLRRLKCDVLKSLPNKTQELVQVPLAPTQLDQYKNLVFEYQNLSKEVKESGAYNAMTMMTDLRKLSNHPLLLRYFFQYEDVAEIANLLAQDTDYKENKVQHVLDDLLVMSDFEIHTLTKQYDSIGRFELPDNLILTSGKFLYLDKKLAELKQNGHRVLIFSQYVIMLNVLEDFLQLKNHSYLRIDGNTPVTERQELIDEYAANPDIFVFLLTTRAGGLGINLSAADTVIIHDIDFNPYNDKQAEDRCHRMGQTKPVKVFRLISQGTLEEGMWQMNQEKLKLEKEVTTEDAENPDTKSVVRLLSSVLGVDNSKMTNSMTSHSVTS